MGLAPYGVLFPVTPGTSRIPVPLDAMDEQTRGVFTATVIRVRAHTAVEPITSLERHPYSVQAFVPLGASRLMALAAPGGAAPAQPGQVRVIHIPPGWGIAYHRGVWHAGLMGEGIDAAVVSMIRRIADGSDTEFIQLPFAIDPAEQTPHA